MHHNLKERKKRTEKKERRITHYKIDNNLDGLEKYSLIFGEQPHMYTYLFLGWFGGGCGRCGGRGGGRGCGFGVLKRELDGWGERDGEREGGREGGR